MKSNRKYLASFLLVLGITAYILLYMSSSARANQPENDALSFDAGEAVIPVLSPQLRDLAIPAPEPELAREANPIRWLGDGVGLEGPNIGLDPLVGQGANDGDTPLPHLTFEGVPSVAGVTPPDTNADVGPNHYIQMTNFHFRIWDKGDPGNGVPPSPLTGQIALGSFFAPVGGGCQSNHGDPYVMYDDLADRWILTQFDLTSPTGMCFAVSQTPDPLGSYWMYNFTTPAFPDYPKLGVWPDAYYMTTNTGFPNQYYVHAFDRVKMMAGLPATRQSFGGLANLMLPADVDGATAPPAGHPGIFYTFYHNSATGHPPGVPRLAIYEFDVDFAVPANTTYTLKAELPVAAFNYTICGFFAGGCIQQPGTGQLLDDIAWWPMHRFQYRNFGGYAAMVGNFSVDADGANHSGIRWFEVRKTGSTYSLFQQGTHFPDTHSRWMGSIAMDVEGNIALGYSVSSNSLIPGIRYATRLAGDPLGTLSAEAVMFPGGGVQTGIHRWGDYSAMVVDPANGCTFWFTTEYHDVNNSGFQWNTRVGIFTIPECDGGPVITPTPTPTGPTPTPTNTPPGPTPTFTATPRRTPTPSGPTPTPTNTPSGGTQTHIADLDGSSVPNGPSRWNATVTIVVRDQNNALVSGATVSGNWSNGTSGSGSCVTNASGTCSITKNLIRNSSNSVTFTVTNIVKGGTTYNPAANTDPDGDSNGTVIVINKP